MNHRLSRITLVVAVASLSSTSGCSLFAGSTQAVHVTTNDPAAEITIDGGFVGKGAGTAVLARDRSHMVVARVGDRVGTTVIDRTISATGILDLIGGVFFLFPLLGLLGDGFWDLDPQSVFVPLPPPAQPAGQ